MSSIDSGLDTEEALALARDFLAELRSGKLKPSEAVLDDAVLDVLHAAVELIGARADSKDAAVALEDASRLHAFVSAVPWAEPDFDEKAELLRACSLWAWRFARRAGKAGVSEKWSRWTAGKAEVDAETAQEFGVDSLAALPIRAEDPEFLLAICEVLRSQVENSPVKVREEGERLYAFLSEPKRPIGIFDERDYFLGALALLVGTAGRLLGHRGDAVRWFDCAEANFRLTVNAVAECSRVSYQRLALLLDERRFEDLLEQSAPLADSFQKLDMTEDALKCRLLEGLALSEAGDFGGAASVFRAICSEAESQGNEKLLGVAYVNLVHVYGFLGRTGDARAALQEALRAMRRLRRMRTTVEIDSCVRGLGLAE